MTAPSLLKRFALFILLILPVSVVFAQKTPKVILKFSSNEARLDEFDKHTIDSLLATLKNIPEAFHCSVTGHTDNVGGENFNQTLSYKRAVSVAEYLQSKGYSPRQVSIAAKGFAAPIAPNNTAEGKEMNRRVELEIALVQRKISSVAGVSITPELYAFNAAEGRKITSRSGTPITIPPAAFVNERGAPVSGKVILEYTEYRDPLDFLLSGIPMHVETASGLEPFNSAGMFTIHATQNGQPVFLQAGKAVQVGFKYNTALPDLSLYRFDTTINNWIELQRLPSTNKGSVAVGENLNRLLTRGACSRGADFEKVFLVNSGLRYANDSDSTLTHFVQSTQMADEIKQAQQAKEKYEKQSKILLKQFRIDLVKQGMFAKEKFKIYQVKGKQDMVTRLLDNLSFSKNFRKSFLDTLYNLSFQQVDIEKKDGSYQLTFYSGLHKTTIDNVLIKLDEKGNKKVPDVIENLNNKNKGYKATVERVRDSLETFTKKVNHYTSELKKLGLNTSLVEDSLMCFHHLNKPYMSSAEKNMALYEWLLYFDQHKADMKQRFTGIKASPSFAASEANVRRSSPVAVVETRDGAAITFGASQLGLDGQFSLTSFGTYNCDQLYKLENAIDLQVTYQTVKGETIQPVIAFLIDNRLNGLVRFDGSFGRGPYNISYNPAAVVRLIVIDAYGDSYQVKPAAFAKVNPNNLQEVYTLTAELIRKADNKQALKRQLGM